MSSVEQICNNGSCPAKTVPMSIAIGQWQRSSHIGLGGGAPRKGRPTEEVGKEDVAAGGEVRL